jgi:hypothetical protein
VSSPVTREMSFGFGGGFGAKVFKTDLWNHSQVVFILFLCIVCHIMLCCIRASFELISLTITSDSRPSPLSEDLVSVDESKCTQHSILSILD